MPHARHLHDYFTETVFSPVHTEIIIIIPICLYVHLVISGTEQVVNASKMYHFEGIVSFRVAGVSLL
jgi:hypothetical protein